ncbi:serine protease 52 isoform X2 [Oryctolagus cuniculus]|uniref:serine protease 52 isoform X2 n=1 Tax=Oryctolagus cuniculus TaxID=9986 RepID=UPI00222F1D4E|nr:serine protease 52 isoform X2 [Oryctolagus cuniculus]
MKGWRDGRAILLLWVALQLAWARGSLEPICGRRIIAKSEKLNMSGVIGGEPASITDFPWQVGILSQGYYLCGGTILSEWWILTASHCFIRANKSNLSIVHGTDDFNSTNLKKVQVDKLIMHSGFDSWILDNDIALLLLKSPLRLDVKSTPICLSKVTNIRKWSGCWVTGWGVTRAKSIGAPSSKLQKVDLKLMHWDTCFSVLPMFTKNMLCARNSQGGKDSCQGDSGGPLICHKKNNNSVWYQLGIVSWGAECGHKEIPGVYTKVSSYLSWIKKKTALAGKPYLREPDSGYSLLLSPWAILFQYFVILLLSW